MRLFAVLLCSLSALSYAAPVAEVFKDKDVTFIRAGKRSGLTVGAEVPLASDKAGTKVTGHATVMEVWDSLARVSLDEQVTRTRPRFAVLPGAADVPQETAAAPSSPPPSAPPPPPEEPAAPERSPEHPKAARLRGTAERGVLRLTITNVSSVHWTQCHLDLPDHRTYYLGNLAPHSEDGIMWAKFHLPEGFQDGITALCDEGTGHFSYADPRGGGGGLKGHVERGNMGRIIVYNDSDRPWSRCLLKQPDGSQYMLGGLSAHSDEGIMPSKFSNPVPVRSVTVRCQEGEAQLPLP